MTDFKLPELGENVTTGDVLRVLVKPGDVIEKDQAVLELETDKATIEVPSSVAGTVQKINVKAGDKVKVGQSILVVEGPGESVAPHASEGGEAPPAKEDAPRQESRAQKAAPKGEESEEPAEPSTRGRGSAASTGGPEKVVAISRGARATSDPEPSDGPLVPASPSVRRMARELGVEIGEVPGSGVSGRISADDVRAHVKGLVAGAGTGGTAAAAPLPDFSRWGSIERRPMRAVRRKTAEHLSAAWIAIPHVTQHDRADVTSLEELRKRYAKQAEAAGGNLTVTAIAVKVVAAALRVFPQFNTSIDLAAEEIVYKGYVNIGVAVDTDRGLLVPVVRDADQKNILRIAAEVTELSEKARTRKITLDEMSGGCLSVSNLGGIGGTSFTPIVNAPEVAILGISRARLEPVWDAAQSAFVPRLFLPLSLSYDHRVIDGADGARFLRWVVDAFEQPFLLALQG